ncbi:hypothetical protein AAFN60_19080 [Roseibacillus persicicus]|uniref:type I-G CRISPR-associated protein, Cas3-extension family n=1 Tax=Roseibacillus persicicus TaxID=454148 RepID=UPI00398B4F03
MSTPNILELPALREDNPRDFLAALGLFRLFDSLWPDLETRLAWSESKALPYLQLSSPPLTSSWAKDILAHLLKLRQGETNPFGLGKIEALPTDLFRSLLTSTLQNDPFLLRFYLSLAGQLSYEGGGRRSEFLIESANRSVLNGIDSLLANQKKPIDFEKDLMGTNSKEIVNNTSRWHPDEYQSAAYAAGDPKDNKHRDFVSLNILALFGLAFYPVLDGATRRATCGFRRMPRQDAQYSWPIWNVPLKPDEVASLLLSPLVHDANSSRQSTRAHGVRQIWRTRKFLKDQNDYFATAEPVF